ncbi:hypothetical protein ACLMJK_006490 [Lecanora helva]
MDGFSASVTVVQAADFALSVVKGLYELRNALKHGSGFLHDEQAGIEHLREIIIQLLPKDRATLDPDLASQLESIRLAVNRLLRLLQQHRRLQIAILLVIRRAEVYDSFALLERKKATLNLYLSIQNNVALSSLVKKPLSTITMPTDRSRRFRASFQDSGYDSQSSASDHSCHDTHQAMKERAPQVYSDQQLPQAGLLPVGTEQQWSQQQEHGASATRDFRYHKNAVSKHGTQVIHTHIDGRVMKEAHEYNTSDNYASQEIGRLSSGRKSTSSLKQTATRLKGAFWTKGNKASNGAKQCLYRPDESNTTASYEENVADTGGMQSLGVDVSMDLPAHKPRNKIWVKAKKPKQSSGQ